MLWLAGCTETPATEDAISQTIKELAQAIEERNSGAVISHLHKDLQINESNHGALDLEQARRLLMATFFRHRNINVLLTNIQVTPDNLRDDLASAQFNALVTAGSGGILPSDAQLYRIQSDWRNDGEWKLLSLQAKRALE
jgi:uncharacterized protein (DUF849 family)